MTSEGYIKNYNIAWYSGGHFGSSRQGARGWKTGDADFGQVDLEAGRTYEIHMEMDWEDVEEARDFSVVVHGMSGGTITVTKSDGTASATLPALEH